ncbi:GNAT family N-acetyltransferase [Desulfococcus sp.]|uniref:bifunctional acetate--CoA ligase family protein/GNAT family N-acetyltransferase n=1 Tax=Desulfococcus sp. TaxID=2025834 RepID=UPI0035945DED
MTIRHLGGMFKPSSIALIGTGVTPGTIGSVVTRNVTGAGYEGDIFLVGDMSAEEAARVPGVLVFPDIAALPGAPDLAVILKPPETVPRILRELGEAGTRAAVVMTPGFPEIGPRRWRRLRQEMRDAAKPHTLRIIGPNSLGIMAPVAFLNAGCAHIQALPGWLAFVGQADSMIISVLDWATHHRIGFSHFISLGDMADVDFGDMLDYLANDHHTRAILLYIETVTHVRKFMSAARAASRMKPVIVFKAGRHHDRTRGGAFHGVTMPGPGSDAVYDAAFRRAGMLRVSNTQALFDAAATLAALQTVAGDRLGILTNSRGAGVLAADSLIDQNGRLAEFSDETVARLREMLPAVRSLRNPVDIGEDAGPDRYGAALDILLGDPGADAVLVLNCPHAVVSSTDSARAVIDVHSARRNPYALPSTLLTSWIGQGASEGHRRLFIDHAIPAYETPDEAIRAFMRMVRYRRNQEMLMETPPNIPDVFTPSDHAARKIIGRVLARGRDRLTTPEALAVLRAYGIPTPETGGAVGAKGEGLQWIPPPHTYKLMIGMTEDPQFGPVIRFGHGGKAVDVIADQALALPPLNLHLAGEVMARTRILRLLKGYGDTPPVDLDAVALALVKVSQLICDTAEIRALVINPLLVNATGVTALDAVIQVSPSTRSPEERLAIRPYPKELEDIIEVKGGGRLLIRPIRPEDEPAFCDLFASLSLEEVRLRFFRYMKLISHSLAARLTQIDYDRQMAFVLSDIPPHEAKPQIYGVVHVDMDPDNEAAEFAIMVRSDMTGMGLGSLLMRRIIEYCRRRGVAEIYGDVLMDNKPMLALSRSLGFRAELSRDDLGAVVVRLPLSGG